MKKEEILSKIIEETTKRLLNTISDDLKNIQFKDIVKTTQEIVNDLGCKIISELVSIVDENYNKNRNRHAVYISNLKTRKIMSTMGEITLTRRLYIDKNSGKCFFAVDELLNIEKCSRIDENLKAKLINDATLTSYGKASALSDNCVSRQSVHNLVKRLNNERFAVRADGFKNVENIYIEADEDHIHLNNGKCAEMKLVYVHEGRKKVNKGRTELKNAKYFVALNSKADIWDEVASFVYEQYKVSGTNIYIAGDGANWIKNGLKYLPRAKYITDKFHVYKSVTDASAGDKSFRRRVISYIKEGEEENVKEEYMDHFNKVHSRAGRHRLADSLAYIQNNFDTIDLTSEYGCSAEGHVSHVLSSRLSSRPMAWSEEGAEKMAKLRAYYFNGGDFLLLTKPEKPIQDKTAQRLTATHKKDNSFNQGTVAWETIAFEVRKVLKMLLK